MSGVHEITINDVESRVMEYHDMPKLRICAVGDEIFLTILRTHDTNKAYHSEKLAEIAVHLEDLKAALGLATDWKT